MFAQSFGEYSLIAGASEGLRDLAHTLENQFFGVDLEIRLMIGLGVLVAIALWARRPSGA